MIIKKIYLENIRSYKSQEIEFSSGSTLLSGDIGSGKTSILLAIEFALFGLQPGQRGVSILRNGEKEGKIKMEFEIDGNNVLIERTLKRGGKSITQDYCSITINGETKEIAVTELKNAILELLNYPSEYSKKQNLLYRFTVYTPQEEMKQIINQDSSTRVNTLRYIFGIDKYKTIIENASKVASKIREEQRIKQGMISNLEQDHSLLENKKEELKQKGEQVILVEHDLIKKTEVRKKFEEDKLAIESKIEEKRKLEQETEKTQLTISHKKDSISYNQRAIQELKTQLENLSTINFDLSMLESAKESLRINKEEKEKINEKNLKIISRIDSLKLKIDDNDNLMKRISHLEVCPTCLQNVDSVYKSNISNQYHNKISEDTNSIKDLELEKHKVSEELKKISLMISEDEKKIRELELTQIKIQQVNEKKKKIEELEKTIYSLQKDLGILEGQLTSLKEDIFDLKRFDNFFSKIREDLDNARREEKLVEIKVAELKKEISVFSNQINELKDRINKTEEIKKELVYLIDLENWMSKKFIPLMSTVEKRVMSKLRKDFSEFFSRWFSMLVSGDFNVKLDDNFTPIIEQQDYEIDYAYLSGGERTAVALAYRLSLNQVINSFLSKIKTKDLVILDEPTDGFSEAQLHKMREVLDQLDVAQLILVSHEQRIESFVENIIRFSKENGTTEVLENL